MHKRNRNRNSTRNHNTGYNVVHPQCRGYVHKTVFLFNLLQSHSLICALSCRSLQSLKSAHTAAGPCAHSCRSFLNLLTKPSAHTAAEVVHAHSWDLTFLTKTSLSFASIHLTSKILTSLLYKSAYLYSALITKPWA